MESGVFLKIVLTGGPCGGKTTAMSRLSDAFSNRGWLVYRASEMATFILSGGVSFSSLSSAQVCGFQKDLLQAMLTVEQVYERLGQAAASSGQNCVLLCDRGAMDISGYMTKEDWICLLDEMGTFECKLCARYSCVLHLVTAAYGAEQYYCLEGNAARSESVCLAKEIDRKLMDAWIGHPDYILIDNFSCGSFDDKLDRVTEASLGFAGLQEAKPGANCRKFILQSGEAVFPGDLQTVSFKTESVILHSSDDGKFHYRLRKREAEDGTATFTLVTRKELLDGQKVETRRSLDEREQEALLGQANMAFEPVRRKRTCFVWNDRHYALDMYADGLVILDAFIGADETELPSFLPTILEEVTHDNKYNLDSK